MEESWKVEAKGFMDGRMKYKVFTAGGVLAWTLRQQL